MNTNEKKRADLHLHSTKSDGYNTPDEVIRLAEKAGLAAIALTDHNLFSFTKPQKVGKMMVIPGCEFSTTYWIAERKDATEVHVVGLFPDGVDPNDFKEIFANIEEGKQQYVLAILQQLAERGIDVSLEEVEASQKLTRHTGRHKIADVLIKKGYAKDMDDAFDHHIGNFSPYYIPATRFIKYAPTSAVVRQIRSSGGIPILAHPYGYMMSEAEIEDLIMKFKSAAGTVAGMEVYYERYLKNPEKLSFLKHMAEEHGLFASASSDRHREDQPFSSVENGMELYQNMEKALHKANLMKKGVLIKKTEEK